MSTKQETARKKRWICVAIVEKTDISSQSADQDSQDVSTAMDNIAPWLQSVQKGKDWSKPGQRKYERDRAHSREMLEKHNNLYDSNNNINKQTTKPMQM